MRGSNINLETHVDSDLLKITLKKLNLRINHAGVDNTIQDGGVGNNSDSFVDTITLGIGTDTQNKIESIFGGGLQSGQSLLSEELTEFSSDVAKSLDVSIHKKQRKTIRPKFKNLINDS